MCLKFRNKVTVRGKNLEVSLSKEFIVMRIDEINYGMNVSREDLEVWVFRYLNVWNLEDYEELVKVFEKERRRFKIEW